MSFINKTGGKASAMELAKRLKESREQQAKSEPVRSVEEAVASDSITISKEDKPVEQLSPLAAMRAKLEAMNARQAAATEKPEAKLANALESNKAVQEQEQPKPANAGERKLSFKERLELKKRKQANEQASTTSTLETKQNEQATQGLSIKTEVAQASVEAEAKSDAPVAMQSKEDTAQASAEEANDAPALTPKLSLSERLRLKREGKALPAALPARASNEQADTQAEQPSLSSEDNGTQAGGLLAPSLGVQGSSQVQAITEANEAKQPANRQQVMLNAKQLEAVSLAKDIIQNSNNYAAGRRGMVLIGKAGTGKTTSVREIIKWLLASKEQGGYDIARTADFKRQNGSGTKDRVTAQPRVVVASFTKKAVVNIKNSCIQSTPELEEAEWCFQSIHNALEYAPEYYEDVNEAGEEVTKMRFAPQKWSGDQIDCDVLIIEEASMVGLDLWAKMIEALPAHCCVIFLGDIAQLPPVFGMPILIYAMHKLPVVELDHVYRTKLGPVLRGAHDILQGKMPTWEEEEGKGALNLYIPVNKADGKTTLANINKIPEGASEISVGETKLSVIYEKLFEALYAKGDYDPEQDIILSPYNKHDLGTINLNKGIAQFLGSRRDAEVYEINAGFEKHYLAVGDKVMVDKQDGVITAIHVNTNYMGSMPQPPGVDLTRYGTRIIGKGSSGAHADFDLDDYANFSLEKLEEMSEEEAAKQAASHIVEVELETGQVITLDKKGSFNSDKFTLGYCLTGHKSQGSEWRNVFIIMHKKHHTNLNREWFYTCLTRTKMNCTVLANPYSVEKSINTQRIAGNTMQEKLAWFTKDCDNMDEVQVCPGS